MNNQKTMKDRLEEIRKENFAIQQRRHDADQKMIDDYRDERRGLGSRLMVNMPFPRWMQRMGASGTPRSVIFSQKMAIPGKRRKK